MSGVDEGTPTNIDIVITILLEDGDLPRVLSVVRVSIDMTGIRNTTRDPTSIPLSTLTSSRGEGILGVRLTWKIKRSLSRELLNGVGTLLEGRSSHLLVLICC